MLFEVMYTNITKKKEQMVILQLKIYSSVMCFNTDLLLEEGGS